MTGHHRHRPPGAHALGFAMMICTFVFLGGTAFANEDDNHTACDNGNECAEIAVVARDTQNNTHNPVSNTVANTDGGLASIGAVNEGANSPIDGQFADVRFTSVNLPDGGWFYNSLIIGPDNDDRGGSTKMSFQRPHYRWNIAYAWLPDGGRIDGIDGRRHLGAYPDGSRNHNAVYRYHRRSA